MESVSKNEKMQAIESERADYPCIGQMTQYVYYVKLRMGMGIGMRVFGGMFEYAGMCVLRVCAHFGDTIR